MPFHLYKACDKGNKPRHLGIRVRFDDDRWVSTCCEVDRDGNELSGASQIAPRFYGVTADQAHRRMLEVLENTYQEVSAAGQGVSA